MTLTAAPRVRSIDLDDGAVLFEPTSSLFVDLSEGGALIWERLRASDFDVASVREWLCSSEGLSHDAAVRIVDDFVNQLLVLGVLVDT